MQCKFCKTRMYDLTNDKGAGRNYLCEKCGTHYYHPIKSFWKNEYHDARWFTKDEWEVYVNTDPEKSLKQVLEENNGYNPEYLDEERYEFVSLEGGLLTVRGKEDHLERTYRVTAAKTMRQYIEACPKTYGIEYEGKFYREF